MSQSLIVEQDMTWSVFVLGHKVEKQANPLLCDIPHHLNHSSFLKLFSILDSVTVCPGSPQPHYLDMGRSRKGNFLSARKQPMAVLETSPLTTIRTVDCHLLTHGLKCDKCKNYEPTLRALHSHWVHKKNSSPKSVSKFTNNRYLDTPQKNFKLQSLKRKAIGADRLAKKLAEKIERVTERNGIEVDANLHGDLLSIMQNNDANISDKFPPGTFRHHELRGFFTIITFKFFP